MHSLPPGSTIGILGGGQLGRMLAMAAARMGYHAHIYCPEENAPAFEVARDHTCAAYDDEAALKNFAASVNVITYEFENIPAAPLAVLGDKLKPGSDALAICQHRLKEKETLAKLGIATAPYAAVSGSDDLPAAIETIGLPAVLKTATDGYDGKGQWILKDSTDLTDIVAGEYVLEGFVDFSIEISVIVARNEKGDVACYPPAHNIHKNHILSETIVPTPIDDALMQKAKNMACTIAEGLGLTGLMAVEMFVCGDKLIVNELAPRPHNSGHWTMDACATSQFEQTLRAICNLPLGSTEALGDAKMINLIGNDVNDWEQYLNMPGATLHLYGKKDVRKGRKMGHVNRLTLRAES